MKNLKFAIFGCGFWSQFKLGAWQEIAGAECVALYNRTKSKADDLAGRFGVPHTYDDPEALLQNEDLDFIDIITDVDTHEQFTLLRAQYGKDVICQKPLAPSYEAAKRMMKATREAGVWFYVHENYRWQPQFRRIKKILEDMLGMGKAENTGDDNFETVKLVWAAYESAAKGKIIEIDQF